MSSLSTTYATTHTHLHLSLYIFALPLSNHADGAPSVSACEPGHAPKGGVPEHQVRLCVACVCVWPHESLTLGGEHRREARAIAYERERERARGAAAAQNGQNIAQKLWSSRAMVPPIAAKHARLAPTPADSGCNCSTPPPKPTPSHLPPPPPPRKPHPPTTPSRAACAADTCDDRRSGCPAR